MDEEFSNLPDDIAALRQALTAARAQASAAEQKHLDTAAELAVAKAMASDDKALLAHQALRIAKLERQLYGPRKERSAQLQDQMEFGFCCKCWWETRQPVAGPMSAISSSELKEVCDERGLGLHVATTDVVNLPLPDHRHCFVAGQRSSGRR
jgi:hypothetical protein